MELRITEESIKHDIEAVDAEIERLKSHRLTLVGLLRAGSERSPSGIKARLKGGPAAYRDAVYHALTRSNQTIREISERSGVSTNATVKYLKALRSEGLAKETTGHLKHQRWVRTEVKIVPGQAVQAALDEGHHAG